MRDFDAIRPSAAQPWAVQPTVLKWLARLDPPAVGPAGHLAVNLGWTRLSASLPGATRSRAAGLMTAMVGGVAVVPLHGLIAPRPGVLAEWGLATDPGRFAAAVASVVRQPEVTAVVLDVDSPGGSVAGVPEAAAEVLAVRRSTSKPMVAVSNTLMASAAYWVGSAAGAVSVSPSSLTGSIGVYAIHEDQSRADDKAGFTVSVVKAGRLKAGTLPYSPLSADARAGMQSRVDSYYAQFLQAVALARSTTPASVRSGYGEGDVLTAYAAVAAGLADRVETLAQAVKRLGGKAG